VLPVKSLSVMRSNTLLDTISLPAPARDYSYVTTTHSPMWGAGVSIDYEFSPNWILTVDGLFNKMRYAKQTIVMSGTDDPNTAQDDRPHIFIDEDTRARFYEFPVLIHRRFSKLYIAGGAAFRTATNITSFSTIRNPDASTTTNRTVVPPSNRNVIGAVIGIGTRIFDDFHLNWTPEIRFTRWATSTYSTTSSVTPKNQLEFGLGFTF
jgi:outer membrane protein with beta-barrel domain